MSSVNVIFSIFGKGLLYHVIACDVLSGTHRQNIHKLQLMQNFAFRILTDTRKYDNTTQALKALGWPTIEEQLRLCNVAMMFQCVNNLVAAYLAVK